ncbi:MAG: hypothetical protein LBK53_06190 [Heliobacteriaceae bacterium]|jgi:hypothetical protein|nr:hypothetical protein [Heliobacteriaceae bacterium]
MKVVLNQYNQPNFTGGESKFFRPVERAYDKLCESAAKNITPKLIKNKQIQWLAQKTQNSRKQFTHLLAVGSTITSGMYAYKTLNNKHLDKDRRQTLAINQLLTLGVSLTCSYTAEGALAKWWEGVTAKYAGIQLEDKNFAGEFVKERAKSKMHIAKYTAKYAASKPEKYSEEAIKKLLTKIDGMDKIKSALIFGFIFRYIVPVAIVPVANRLGDKYLEYKKNK